ncbi:hypothetical protein ACRRTK_018018 [Alexandromys fortis]
MTQQRTSGAVFVLFTSLLKELPCRMECFDVRGDCYTTVGCAPPHLAELAMPTAVLVRLLSAEWIKDSSIQTHRDIVCTAPRP